MYFYKKIYKVCSDLCFYSCALTSVSVLHQSIVYCRLNPEQLWTMDLLHDKSVWPRDLQLPLVYFIYAKKILSPQRCSYFTNHKTFVVALRYIFFCSYNYFIMLKVMQIIKMFMMRQITLKCSHYIYLMFAVTARSKSFWCVCSVPYQICYEIQ